MTPQEIYELFLTKINKNDTRANVKVDKGHFVLLFNQEKRAWLKDTLERTSPTLNSEQLEDLLVLDKKLRVEDRSKMKDDFFLPTDFFKSNTAYSFTSKGKCTESPMVVWIIKPKDKDVYLQNEHLKPSFEYQETFGIVNSGKISIYKNDFNINEAFLTYYREPVDLDIEGYQKLDGSLSENVSLDLIKISIEQIIDRTVAEVLRIYENPSQQTALQKQTLNERI